jgi:ATP-binding cassette subfamily B protein
MSTLAETINAITVIENDGLPTSVVFFEDLPLQRDNVPSNVEDATNPSLPKGFSGGWRFHLADTKAALKLVSLIAASILALFAVKGLLSFGHTYIMSRVGQKLILNLREELYSRLVHFPLGFFTQRRTGDIMARGTSDMAALQNSIKSMSSAVRDGAIVLIFVVVMFIKSWQLTILTALIFPPAIYVINRIGRRIRGASTRIQEKVADISSYLERTIFGIKIIKSFATEDWEKERFAEENRTKYSVAMKRVRLSAYLIPLIEIMTSIGMVSVFWLGFWQVITGRLTTGWFIVFTGMVVRVYKPVKTLGTFNAAFQQAVASAQRIFEILDVQPEAHDAPDAVPIPSIKGDVEFRDVSFTYDLPLNPPRTQGGLSEVPRTHGGQISPSPPRPRRQISPSSPQRRGQISLSPPTRGGQTFPSPPTRGGQTFPSPPTWGGLRGGYVLNHINLKVDAGELIALVGPSGVGKTTLVSLLTRFYEVTSGDITIDGYPISKITLRSLRQQVGLVPQETVIFGGTVRENIAYGRFDATEEEIIQAAKSANAHEFITQFSNGYDTSIGERGMQISGGQRQRLAIARAILKDPRILILDEATSSLDTESEALIQEALANLMKGRTTFVIAHRLSTVMNADRILVLKDGEIAESGTHTQLFANNGLYRKLCDAQFRSGEDGD